MANNRSSSNNPGGMFNRFWRDAPMAAQVEEVQEAEEEEKTDIEKLYEKADIDIIFPRQIAERAGLPEEYVTLELDQGSEHAYAITQYVANYGVDLDQPLPPLPPIETPSPPLRHQMLKSLGKGAFVTVRDGVGLLTSLAVESSYGEPMTEFERADTVEDDADMDEETWDNNNYRRHFDTSMDDDGKRRRCKIMRILFGAGVAKLRVEEGNEIPMLIMQTRAGTGVYLAASSAEVMQRMCAIALSWKRGRDKTLARFCREKRFGTGCYVRMYEFATSGWKGDWEYMGVRRALRNVEECGRVLRMGEETQKTMDRIVWEIRDFLEEPTKEYFDVSGLVYRMGMVIVGGSREMRWEILKMVCGMSGRTLCRVGMRDLAQDDDKVSNEQFRNAVMQTPVRPIFVVDDADDIRDDLATKKDSESESESEEKEEKSVSVTGIQQVLGGPSGPECGFITILCADNLESIPRRLMYGRNGIADLRFDLDEGNGQDEDDSVEQLKQLLLSSGREAPDDIVDKFVRNIRELEGGDGGRKVDFGLLQRLFVAMRNKTSLQMVEGGMQHFLEQHLDLDPDEA